MRVLVIGGTGHVGTYMIPRLVHLGHEVIVVRARAALSPLRHDLGTWAERRSPHC
jgi:uncharacterized protein YbjT (DUF2867 family)